ncbi:MAG TPA: LysR family transcriptional regulator [Dokdonella sp.]
MHEKNLRSVDLNLLVVLHALLDERSVTRAAARLFITQPAASHALDRLRTQFGDRLLERRGAQMALTPRAEELQAPLRELLGQVHGLLRTPATPLRELVQTVHVAMADYPAILVVPRLWARLRKVAPGIDLVVHGWAGLPQEIERLRRGDVGVALSTLVDVPDDIEKQHIADSDYVGLMAKRHALGSRPSAARFVSFPHVLVSATGASSSPFDRRLAEQGLRRRIGVSVASFLAVPAIVAASDAIALVPRSLAEHWAPAKSLARFRLPVDPGRFSIDIAWHRRRAQDPAIQAVRAIFVEILQALT